MAGLAWLDSSGSLYKNVQRAASSAAKYTIDAYGKVVWIDSFGHQHVA